MIGTRTAVTQPLSGRPAHVFGFPEALARIKEGHRLARHGWNGRGMWVEMQVPDEGSKMTLPYLFLRTADGELVPWLASQTDLLAEDWHMLPVEAS